MSYHKMLSAMIKDSGFTLREIVEKCKQEGVSIDQSYISKLQTDAQKPASDEVNIALAKVCGVDPDDLLFEAYMEKAPNMIRKLITQISDFFKQFLSVMSIQQLPPDMVPIFKQQIESISQRDLIKMILDTDFKEMLEGMSNTMSIKDLNGEENRILFNPYLGIKMPDNSMSPLIPIGAQLQLDNPTTVGNGDIVFALIAEDDYLVRRYVLVDNKIILIAENNAFEPLTFSKDSIKIVGRVKSYTNEL